MNSMYQLEVESQYWLEKALEVSEYYMEQDVYDWFFEADDNAKQTSQNNEKVKKNTDTLIGNAARAIIKMIENIINDIKKWTKNIFNKHKLQTMQQQLKESGKGKSLIKTADNEKVDNVWKNIFKKTDDAINAAQNEDENNVSDDTGEIERLIGNIEGFANEQLKELGDGVGDVAKMGSAWVTTIAAEYGMRMAVDSAGAADQILHLLETDKRYMQQLERDLGEARAKNYKKKIKKLTKLYSLYKFRVKLRGRYVRTKEAITRSIIDDCTEIIGDLSSGVVNGHPVKGTVKGVAKDQLKGSFASSFSSQEKRNAARRADLKNKLLTNKHTKEGIKGGLKIGEKIQKTKYEIQSTINTNDRTKKQSFFDKLLHGNGDY